MYDICQCWWILAGPPLVLICFSCHLGKLCYLAKTELRRNYSFLYTQAITGRIQHNATTPARTNSFPFSLSLSLPYYQSVFGARDSLVYLSYRLIK